MKEMVSYFCSLTFDTTPPMCLFFEEKEPSALPLHARRYFHDSVVFDNSTIKGELLLVHAGAGQGLYRDLLPAFILLPVLSSARITW